MRTEQTHCLQWLATMKWNTCAQLHSSRHSGLPFSKNSTFTTWPIHSQPVISLTDSQLGSFFDHVCFYSLLFTCHSSIAGAAGATALQQQLKSKLKKISAISEWLLVEEADKHLLNVGKRPTELRCWYWHCLSICMNWTAISNTLPLNAPQWFRYVNVCVTAQVCCTNDWQWWGDGQPSDSCLIRQREGRRRKGSGARHVQFVAIRSDREQGGTWP